MCAPSEIVGPLIGAGMQGAGSLFSYFSQKKQAQIDQANADRQLAATRSEATASTRMALQDLDARNVEEMLATANANENLSREGEHLRSTAVVAAGESGVTGQSIDELLNDVKSQTGRAIGTNKANLNISEAQNARQRDQVIATGKSQYNSVQPVDIKKPSLVGALLGVAGAGLQASDSISSYKQSLKIPLKGI